MAARALAGALLTLLTVAPVASAQFLIGPTYGRGVGLGYTGRHLSISAYLGGPGYGFFGRPHYCPPPAYFGYGYGYPAYAVVPAPAPVFVVPQPIVIPPPPPLVVVPGRPVPEPEENRRFGVFRPNPNGVLPPIAPRRPMPPAEPPPKQPPKPMPPARDFPPPVAAPPEGDLREEARRLMRLGRDAFAAGEYGRAAERFRAATDRDPANAEAHFLLAHAQLALGKYAEAVASVHAGIRLDPQWPRAKFRPRELYGDDAAAHTLHQDRLRQAAERNPDEPALWFLRAYQLWFDDRRDEARPLFRKVLPLVADPDPVRRFLDTPDADVVRN